ncbi:MAG: 5-formyltetrahydrofolate cyclo-ligase [Bacillota bacterium]|nr:5-formyltetrahydrofolate cyclo-ligase [Bacillota bacterium]
MKIHMEDITPKRNELRAEMKTNRNALSSQQVEDNGKMIADRLQEVYLVSRAQTIMVFASIQNEVDLRPFIENMQQKGKRILLPRVEKDGSLSAVEFTTWESCVKSSMGILEPVGPAVPMEEINVVLVPGLVFDGAGYRLGYGKGYYDRFLKDLQSDTFKCGVCYDFQIINDVLPQPTDIPVHWIVTDKSEMGIDFNYF